MKLGIAHTWGRRRREAASLIASSAIAALTLIAILYLGLGIVPRAIELASLSRMDGDFSALKTQIIEAARGKSALEKSLSGRKGARQAARAGEYHAAFLGAAKEAGLEILDMGQGGSPKDREGSGAAALTLRLEGEYRALVSFLSSLEGFADPVALDYLKVSTPDGVSGRLSCELGLRILRR